MKKNTVTPMIPLIIAFVYPFGTPDEENFLNKVKQQPAVLAQRIIPIGCDQKKDTISDNLNLIKSHNPDIIILSPSIPERVFEQYSIGVIKLRSVIRPSEPELQIFYYADGIYDEDELSEIGVDECYPTLGDLVMGIVNYVKFRPL